ncbi:MAG TPA: PadR family transcriptional regulator [Streptosporangiaceae bacterium]|nr:PadR family transcriptional regulator [Streptosporangiaceae bacterium]
MSPVFRHGKLRLYLLKLLDEAPRHGYEVIRLLQDRFMGVYAPSPGTIYPRLARLEEEGLVTHDTVGGRKIYRITDKGRAEIESKLDDLADLEQEITDSVRDIAREVSEDVRDTVRSLREELTWAAREGREGGARDADRDAAREQARRAREEVKDSARRARRELLGEPAEPEPEPEIVPARGGRGRRDGPAWPDWTGWASRAGWASWKGPGGPGGWGPGRPGRPDARILRDLERLAINFASQLRSAAWHTEALGSDKLSELRAILEDTMTRIRDEVFTMPDQGHDPSAAKASETTPGETEPSARNDPPTG